MLFFYLKLIPVSVTQWTNTTQVTKGEQILSNTAITVASWATLFNESSDIKKKVREYGQYVEELTKSFY